MRPQSWVMLVLVLMMHATASAEKPSLLVIGDSIDLGVGAPEPYVEIDGWRVKNASIVGMSTRSWIKLGSPGCQPAKCGGLQLLDALAGDFDVITIHLGSNDARGIIKGGPVLPDEYRENLIVLVEYAHARWPKADILIH